MRHLGMPISASAVYLIFYLLSLTPPPEPKQKNGPLLALNANQGRSIMGKI